MKIRVSREIKYLLFFAAGAWIGVSLLCGVFLLRNQADRTQEETSLSEKQGAVLPDKQESVPSEGQEAASPEDTEITVDYPFSDSEEGWSLVLRESGGADAQVGDCVNRRFCLYDEKGELKQEFSCSVAAKEVTFRFDRLFYYYGYDEDLIVFPAEAEETGEQGLCYPWDGEAQKFMEEPVSIPWYQEGTVQNQTFMTVKTEENAESRVICRINKDSRKVVELRKWTLHRNEETGEEILHIWDCLEQCDLYYGKVERNELGNLANDEYYQYLFGGELEPFCSWENDSEIETEKYLHGGGIERVVYADKEAFLADCGFGQETPFYEDYDRFQNLTLELYVNSQTGQGCGIRYMYRYNYKLEKVVSCSGFIFDEAETERRKWEPEEIFSTLSIEGTDARKNNVSGYSETYAYTDEGRLSHFESRGTIVDYGENGPMEDTLLSMDFYYRDDGTLYYKEYRHHHILFGTTFQWQCSDYDEQERLVYRSAYITHGVLEYYYIYEGDCMEPAYCLEFDHGGGLPVLVVYDGRD